jgi:hypothetical protein
MHLYLFACACQFLLLLLQLLLRLLFEGLELRAEFLELFRIAHFDLDQDCGD